jgi:hypothetical protein
VVSEPQSQDFLIHTCLRWFFVNPIFLSLEIIFINIFLDFQFDINEVSFLGGSVFAVFSLIYFFLDFSPVTPAQTSLILMAAISELILSFGSYDFSKYWIMLILVIFQIVVGFSYYRRSPILVSNDGISIHGDSFPMKDLAVEVRIRMAGGFFGFGDITIHHAAKKHMVSGIHQPMEVRRVLIDDYDIKPHPQHASWTGTLIPFLTFLTILLSANVVIFSIMYSYFNELSTSFRILASIISMIFFVLILLNIRIPRVRMDPASDLLHLNIINTGTWTQIFEKTDSLVVKQLYRCGWGHNDYRDHKAPVIGKKICGKWNPLALVLMHNLMLIYQMIGVHRRMIYEHEIQAIPRTYITAKSHRYIQDYVANPLNSDNVPEDIVEQFVQLNNDLERCGLFIDDIHAGNVRLTENGKVRIVDGELYTGGEMLVKNVLVKGIDNRIDNMQPVLGCNRIIRWVDDRLSVDEIVR